MVYEISLTDGFVISDDQLRLDISDDQLRLDMAFIHRALAGAYWTVDRTAFLTERIIANCLCFGIYRQSGDQIDRTSSPGDQCVVFFIRHESRDTLL